MSLLTNVMEHSLDDGYAEAAARRGEEGRAGLPRTLRAKLGLAGGLLLAALVVTVGAAQARVDAPTLAKERQELIDRVQQRTADTDKLQEHVDSLRDTVRTMQNKALEHDGGGHRDATALLAAATAVHGPGVKLVIDDAEDSTTGDSGGPRQSTGFSDTGRVRDRDMQRVVNGLWASGAEAVSINGERLTAMSAIRAAGEAILVDNKPLAPPYTVLAIGDGKTFADAFRHSVDGRYLDVLHENYGVRYSISVQDEVRLPAASGLLVRTATPVQTGKGSTS
jgi:uncharacterized protein YlxW (UPF0749 family)